MKKYYAQLVNGTIIESETELKTIDGNYILDKCIIYTPSNMITKHATNITFKFSNVVLFWSKDIDFT